MAKVTIHPKTAFRATLDRDQKFAGVARRMTRRALWAWRLPHLYDDAEHIVAELVANAVAAGRHRLTVSLDLPARVVRIEVRDHREGDPVPRAAGTDETGGRGLFIVAALADAWGVRDHLDGHTVWADLAIGGRHDRR